jgi:hypothetical protein
MNDPEDGILKSRDHLFTFLTALIKKNGGKLVVTEAEIGAVVRSDLVSVKYDPKNKAVIFECQTVADDLGYTSNDPNSRQDN